MPVTDTRLQQHSEELISEEVREIISYRPHWMIRRGNLIFLAVIIGLLSLTWFIQYPDVVYGQARLVALNAPKTTGAKNEGKLLVLHVTQGQQVNAGNHLAVLESTADYKEVTDLQSWVNAVVQQAEHNGLEALIKEQVPYHYQLGSIQNSYQAFVQEYKELKQFFGSGYYQQKKAALKNDLVFVGRLKENLLKQTALTRKEQEMQEKEFLAYDSLARDKLVAPMDVNKYRSGLIGKEQALAQAEAQLINSDLAVHNKQKELLDLQKQVLDQQQKLIAALLVLKTEIQIWIRQYVVVAPESGHVYFQTPLQVNQQLAAGQEMFYIQPRGTGYYAQLMIGQNGLGKIKEQQTVRLKVENYPNEEFGYVKGTVQAISGFPNRQDSFMVAVNLPDGIKTVYGKQLFFRNNMLAKAEVITDDRKLLHRFFSPIRKLWQQ